MGTLDFGDISDLRIRLEVLAQEADRRLVTVFGSGISNSVLPGVTELTGIFREHVPSRGLAKFDETIAPLTDAALKYQNAAAQLTNQAGERTVMRAIRSAVLRGCHDVPAGQLAEAARDEDACREFVQSGSWNVPAGYQRFARFFAALSGRVRGPVITTNFDPLIEIALREAGLPATPIPIPTNAAPTPAQLQEATSQPVLHIHGYWLGNAASNVPSRITAPRPLLDDVLRELLRDSVVLVVGYSGWLDGFMKSLRGRVRDEAALLQTEVLWASYERDPAAAAGALAGLVESPGFSLYLGVDGHELFADEPEAPGGVVEQVSSPFRYSWVPQEVTSEGYAPGPFAEGSQPGWADAAPGRWPALHATETLEERLRERLERGGGGGVVAIGPLGEGKSLALRQVAMRVAASGSGWSVLWREPGAPPLTDTWLREVRATSDRTLVCVDEADLVADELAATQGVWAREDSGLAFLLASHDRLWWQGAGRSLGASIPDVLFHGITPADAENIAGAWRRMDLLPSTGDGDGGGEADDAGATAEAARRLSASAGTMAAETNTLFGAMLDVRYGAELGNRVEDLLRKLCEIKLTEKVTLGDVFGGICLLQHTLDKKGNDGKGASRPVIAAMVGLDSVFADGKILRILGREAAVTFAGDRVYSRHPAIAETVVAYLRREGMAEKVCALVGTAGGALRAADARDEDGYRDAYMLSRHLPMPEAVWAATGAVEGTMGLLEPRVTLLSTLRREGSARAVTYARKLAPLLSDYRDYHRAVRAYLVDFSIAMRDEGHAQTATGLAALALDDRVGFGPDANRAGYALVSLTKSALRLTAQTRGGATDAAPAISYVLLELIGGREEAVRFLGPAGDRLGDLDEFRRLSAAKLCGKLGSMLSPTATSAAQECELPVSLDDMLSFDILRQIAERRRH